MMTTILPWNGWRVPEVTVEIGTTFHLNRYLRRRANCANLSKCNHHRSSQLNSRIKRANRPPSSPQPSTVSSNKNQQRPLRTQLPVETKTHRHFENLCRQWHNYLRMCILRLLLIFQRLAFYWLINHRLRNLLLHNKLRRARDKDSLVRDYTIKA